MGDEDLTRTWLRRGIPLPREAAISSEHVVSASDLSLRIDGSESRLLDTVKALMSELCRGRGGASEIRFTGLESRGGDDPHGTLAERVLALPNADQAYAVVPDRSESGSLGLLVMAPTDLGLLYGARTLKQLIVPTMRETQAGDCVLHLPELNLVDWPDMAERGQWGGSAAQDLAWMAERKLNMVEYAATLSVTEAGTGSATIKPEVLDEARRVGIKVVPYISHLEQLFRGHGMLERRPDLASTPDPDAPLPSDYFPGICFSNPGAVVLAGEWLSDLVSCDGITDVGVWLSEEARACHCETCKGQEPFSLEVKAICEAFEGAKVQNPQARLRLLLTQASYPVNDRILDLAPDDVKITYYHGGLTYDSTHNPMIYPRLASFAESGRWLGVYPQVTTSWRAVTPFTGPSFIRARMNEFVAKGLSSVTTYAVPANRFHAYNVTASAEWLWNNEGRAEQEFSEVWAERNGIGDPKLFARWASTVGPVGWSLAGSRLALRLIYGIDREVCDGHHPLQFGQGILAEIYSEEDLLARIHEANRAIAMALDLGDAAAIAESRIVRAFLRLAGGLQILSCAPLDAEGLSPGEMARYRVAFEEIDAAARTLEVEHHRWSDAVADGELPDRLLDTIAIGYRTAASAVGVIRRLGMADPAPEYRPKSVGCWSPDDFDGQDSCTISLAMSEAWVGPGPYVLTFEYTDGASGVTVGELRLLSIPAQGSETPMGSAEGVGHVNRYSRWQEARFRFPEIPEGAAPAVQAGLRFGKGVTAERRISNGVVTARRGLWL